MGLPVRLCSEYCALSPWRPLSLRQYSSASKSRSLLCFSLVAVAVSVHCLCRCLRAHSLLNPLTHVQGESVPRRDASSRMERSSNGSRQGFDRAGDFWNMDHKSARFWSECWYGPFIKTDLGYSRIITLDGALLHCPPFSSPARGRCTLHQHARGRGRTRALSLSLSGCTPVQVTLTFAISMTSQYTSKDRLSSQERLQTAQNSLRPSCLKTFTQHLTVAATHF